MSVYLLGTRKFFFITTVQLLKSGNLTLIQHYYIIYSSYSNLICYLKMSFYPKMSRYLWYLLRFLLYWTVPQISFVFLTLILFFEEYSYFLEYPSVWVCLMFLLETHDFSCNIDDGRLNYSVQVVSPRFLYLKLSFFFVNNM